MDQAQWLINSVTDQNEADYQTRRPIGYPLFLALFAWLQPVGIVILQTILSLFNIPLMIAIKRKLNLQLSSRFYVFILSVPAVFVYTHLLMTEWMVTLLINLLFFQLLFPYEKKRFFYVQLITAGLILIKPVFYPLAYFNLLFFAIYFYRIQMFSMWIFLPVLVVQSVMLVNQSVMGYRHFSSIENFNLLEFNLKLYKRSSDGEQAATKWIEPIRDSLSRLDDNALKNQYAREQAFEELSSDITGYAIYHVKTAIRGLVDPGRYDLMTFGDLEDTGIGFMTVLNSDNKWQKVQEAFTSWSFIIVTPLLILAIIKWGFFFYRVNFRQWNWRVAYFFLFFGGYVLLTGPVNTARYMAPFQLIVILVASSATAIAWGSTDALGQEEIENSAVV